MLKILYSLEIYLLMATLAMLTTSISAGESPTMDYQIEHVKTKYVIGLEVLTSNENFLKDVSPIWEKFFQENLSQKISASVSSNLIVVYTDYVGDYTQPFNYILGCEVENIDVVPEGMVGVEIPSSDFAVFTAKGDYPQSLIHTWQTIWKSSISRSYTSDFEVYPANFNPQNSPEIKVYIAI